MSIAEKLTTIAENEQKVYNAGYEKGKAEGGGSDENNYKYASRVVFDIDILPPKVVLNLDNITSLAEMFGDVPSLEEVTINSKSPNIHTATRMFYKIYYKKLRKITIGFDTSKLGYCENAFSYIETKENGVGIVEINGVLDISNAITVKNMFQGSSGLKEVRFAKNCIKLSLSFASCQFLSNETVESIIDGLADLTGGTMKELDFHSDIVNKLTEEQWLQIYNKNWSVS